MENHLSEVQIDRWVDGEVSPGEEAFIRSHLMKCPFCRARVEEVKMLRRLLHSSMPELLESRRGIVWARIERSIGERRRCPLRLENFVWPSLLTLLYGATAGLLTLVMVTSVAGFFGIDFGLLQRISSAWSLVMETAAIAALGGMGTVIAAAGSVPGADVLLDLLSEIFMEVVVLAGIAGLYFAWLTSLDGSSLFGKG
jgi:anti-sigma factor RsiW